ncbi:MAG: hypothetical protein FJ041_02315 [Candidatus Cloacimonetes bacterium]|nr:hypothetical protein [Candidatus Cloacimonadota bacterium]
MTNTQRNTTVISVLLALVLASGLFLFNKLRGQYNVVDKKNKDLTAKIVQLDKMLAMKEKIERDYEELKLMLAEQSKVIVQEDNPAITFNYLLQVLKWMKRNINFDFSMSSKKVSDSDWNEYIVSGNSHFMDMVNFIKNIEYQRPLLTIEELSVNESNVVSDTVMFSFVFKTHIKTDGTAMNLIRQKDVPAFIQSYVVFKPRIYDKPIETDIDPSLLRIDKITIVGITETRVFLRDENGIIHILSVGEPVAYGYLYSIDNKQDKVIFKTNQYGTSEDKILYLQKK